MTLEFQHIHVWAIDINTHPSYSKTTYPDMVLGSSFDPDVTIVLGGSKDHSDQYGPCGSMALRHPHGLR